MFEQGEFDAVASDGVDAGEPGGGAVAEFIELAGLGAKDMAEVMGGVAFHDGGGSGEMIDEEAAAHVGNCSANGRGKPLPYKREVSRRCL